jgi:hypothetical protein
MRSRDCREKLMPLVPMEMPSLTPMVLNRRPTSPASSTPAFTSAARSFRCMLQGLPSHHTLLMPTCGARASPERRAVMTAQGAGSWAAAADRL